MIDNREVSQLEIPKQFQEWFFTKAAYTAGHNLGWARAFAIHVEKKHSFVTVPDIAELGRAAWIDGVRTGYMLYMTIHKLAGTATPAAQPPIALKAQAS